MRPKIRVKPLATMKYSAAAVTPFSSVMRKSLGSETADPKVVPDAMNSTQTTGNAMNRTRRTRPATRSVRLSETSVEAKAART
jgi:hypothetical protein